jgi:hypothetical protein
VGEIGRKTEGDGSGSRPIHLSCSGRYVLSGAVEISEAFLRRLMIVLRVPLRTYFIRLLQLASLQLPMGWAADYLYPNETQAILGEIRTREALESIQMQRKNRRHFRFIENDRSRSLVDCPE